MEGARLTRRRDSTRTGSKPSSSSNNSQQKEATRIKGEKGEATESAILTGIQESNENEFSSSIVEQREGNPIEIDGPNRIWSVAFVADGEHIVRGSEDGTIRRWRMKDGKEVGAPMNAGFVVWDIAVSRDGRWIVSGTSGPQVTVWNAENHGLVTEFKGHDEAVYALAVSPDATTIATGSFDKTACIWSLSTGQRLLGPFKHDHYVVAVKFSPDGRLIATATYQRNSVRIYDSRDGRLLVNFSIKVTWSNNQSLAWVSDSKQLFVLSHDGNIHHLDVLTQTTLVKWPIHSNNSPRCISLASNGTFIAASDDSSVSFWDTTTHEQIGSVIHHPTSVDAMAISANYNLLTGGGTKIILRNLHDILPSSYFDVVSVPVSNG